jgi:Ni/Co efflux regulator RcnB
VEAPVCRQGNPKWNLQAKNLQAKEILMKTYNLAIAATAVILALCGTAAVAQDTGRGGRDRTTTQFDSHDQQVTRDWYNQHQNNPPAGLRSQDRLSADQESRMQEGAVLDNEMRRHVHPAPPDLARRLPPPPRHHRYVAMGGHIGMIDNGYHVKALIHLHDN